MSKLKAMKSVYCYFFPETRSLLREVSNALPDSMYLVTTPAEEIYKRLEPLFTPPLDIPATPEGYVDLDEIHGPIIKRIVKAYSSIVPALSDFKFSYPTSGSSEGIFKLLTKLKIEDIESINVFDGEYEGYEEYAGHDDLKIRVRKFDFRKTNSKKCEPGVWFISNPSSCDGNIIPNEFITDLCDAGNKVILDLAYVGATRQHKFDISHENIPAVVMSFSKSYGVFRFRIGGFAFSREPIHSLYGNKWFKDTESLCQALKISETIGPSKLYSKYRPVQEEIVTEINDEFGLGMMVSDSFLLGHLTEEDAERLDTSQLDLIKPFKRGRNYRFCLTPYYEEKEQKCEKNDI
ncbi:MAG: aminotransferase class I/II-fold pyridoxal phosphate-dependent enzyme [Candidatus Aenigmatarchaeota archaeon]